MGVVAEKEPRLTPWLYRWELWEPGSLESWLSAQSAGGRHLHECGNIFFWFAKGEKKAVRYRVEAISHTLSVPSDERRVQMAEMGWDYVDTVDRFAIYACEDPAAPELHTDPVTQSYTMDYMAKRLRGSVVFYVIFSLALLAFFVWGFSMRSVSVLEMIEEPRQIFSLLLLPFYLFLMAAILARNLGLLALRRRLKAGISAPHTGAYRWRAAGSAIVFLAMLILVGLGIWSGFYAIARSDWRSVTADDPSPIAYSLAELENDPAYAAIDYTGSFGGVDYNNYVDTLWSPLAPTQYRVVQRGKVPGRVWRDGEAYEPQLTMHCYQLLIPALARPLYDDLLRQEGGGRIQTPLFCPGVDEAVLLTSPESTRDVLLLRTGNRVLHVEYWGEADLAPALPALAAALP